MIAYYRNAAFGSRPKMGKSQARFYYRLQVRGFALIGMLESFHFD
jgi:hypothetical protein